MRGTGGGDGSEAGSVTGVRGGSGERERGKGGGDGSEAGSVTGVRGGGVENANEGRGVETAVKLDQ